MLILAYWSHSPNLRSKWGSYLLEKELQKLSPPSKLPEVPVPMDSSQFLWLPRWGVCGESCLGPGAAFATPRPLKRTVKLSCPVGAQWCRKYVCGRRRYNLLVIFEALCEISFEYLWKPLQILHYPICHTKT